MTSPTPYQLLPRLTNEEYDALKADIAENGVRVPIDVDENGTVLDGHHRAWITAELGIDCPRRTVAGLSEEQKRTHAVAVNVHRRSLSREQRREVVAKLRSGGMAVRAIATTMGVPKSTVSDDLRDVSGSGHVSLPDTITDSLGREQPATRTRPAPHPEPPSDADLLDGREWAQSDGPGSEDASTPPPAAPKPKRRPLPEEFNKAAHDFVRAAERLARIHKDDRFERNRHQTHHRASEFVQALVSAAELATDMDLPSADTSEEARRWWATSLHKISDALTDVANSLEQEQ
jgi:ParB-like chromosome segregation protein Spo0J